MDQHLRSENPSRRMAWREWPELHENATKRWRHGQWPEEFRDIPPDQFPPVPESTSSHPELEDDMLVAWGLSKSDDERGTTILDVCSVEAGQVEWDMNVDDTKLKNLVDKFPKDGGNSQGAFRVFFINTLASGISWLPGNFNLPPSMLKILLKVGLSKVILTEIFTYEGAFAKMGPQCFEWRNANDYLSRFEVCYRTPTGWDAGASYIQFTRTASQTTYFCINYPHYARHRFTTSLKSNPNIANKPFHLDTLTAADGCREWRRTIGQRRQELIRHESQYADNASDYYTLTRHLHRLARDWNTLNQDCADYVSTLQFLQRAYGRYCKATERSTWRVERDLNAPEYLEALKLQGENCVRWTSVYRDRTNIRINLLFHLSNQRDALTSKEIAISTAEVAELTQRDSSSMITMAAVTMLFLPGTFISTILSTTFFDYGKETLDVSRKWWVLPATTIPTTIVVFAAWWLWRRWRLKGQAAVLFKYDGGQYQVSEIGSMK
ncbi:hypothetical protein DM02DRAFT_666696 [Periconia macrospinosa]|uniref:Uncharacterized protein n=1 Tax=Periconia macrospinosa TaxID=97972 RepID=A0A2V1EAG2_9PLEO|nr:hypothetical protein DM02DRAFT_666696 [Periconia macrospinosa]